MIDYIINSIGYWGYPAMFIGGFLEGLNVTLAGSFLIAHGIFSVAGVFIACAAGNYASDLMWYFLGRKYGMWGLEQTGVIHPVFRMFAARGGIEWVKRMINNHSGKALFITKFAVGPGIATQVAAGAMQMTLKKYALYSFIANAAFTASLIAVGFGFGQSYRAAARLVRNAGLLLSLFILIVIFLEAYGMRWFRSYFNNRKETIV